MKIFLLLFAATSFSLFVTGCKQEVGFNPSEVSERAVGQTPIENSINGPVVKIVKAPQDHLVGESTDVVFQVLKGDFEIADVVCLVNENEIPCDWQKGIVDLGHAAMGEHLFEVIATDSEGLQGKAYDFWQVYSRYMKSKDEVEVRGENQSDILFVIDNSASMVQEQRKISSKFNRFIRQLDDLNWHIGIITTDARSSKVWGDGKLHSFGSVGYFLSKDLGVHKAQELFSRHVRRPEGGSKTEMGIHNTYRSIERAFYGTTEDDKNLRRFFRPDAALSVVVVSDEDESGAEYRNKGENLIRLVEESWGKDKLFQFNSIIVHTRSCLLGEGYLYGEEYEKLSKKTGGVVGDICANNYSRILRNIGSNVASLQKVYNLKCVPQDLDKDGLIDLEIVSKDGHRVPGYTIDQRRVEFDKPLKVGDYEFHYFCLK